jgi:hypothetical protein
MFHDHVGYEPSSRETDSKKLTPPDHLEFATAADEDRWRSRAARGHSRLNKRDVDALAEQPDGKAMFVQTKSVAQRSRMGITFTMNARRKVVVVNKTDEEVAALNATGGIDLPNPSAKPREDGGVTTEKVACVTPLGAKAILSDDGLLVYEAPSAVAEGRVAMLEQALADKDAAIAAKDAELASLRAANGREGGLTSDRLGKDAKRSAQSASDAKAAAAAGVGDTQVDPKK